MGIIELKMFILALFTGSSPDITANCETLAALDLFPKIQITSSKAVSVKSDLPAFCQIQGTIKPDIGFEARFPIAEWNGK